MRSLFIFCISILTVGNVVFGQNRVAITIDDLPYHSNYRITSDEKFERTTKLLSAAKSENVPLTGFVNEGKLYQEGKLNQREVDALELWLKGGHVLGNHTYSHMDYNALDSMAFLSDVINGEKVTKELCKQYSATLKYFRHPYLHRGMSKGRVLFLENFLKERQYQEAPVTLDNSEWIFAKAYDSLIRSSQRPAAEKLGEEYVNYMEQKLKFYERNSLDLFGRNISHVLLIHANNLNADNLRGLLKMFVRNNYEFISLEEALKDPCYNHADQYYGRGGISWLHRWALTEKRPPSFYKDEPAVSKQVLSVAKLKSE